ncbi:MAG: class I SAM-dependent methyltransferase [Myxococcales bacterium]|jgi:ubiquinone/menaquinone biosynthesis C-methylase UbiE
MSAIYDSAHVRISQIIGRRHNNPLGESPFGLLRRLIGHCAKPRVLDLGCGRGATTLWWARDANARVTAVDPSADMLEEARRLLATEGLESRVVLLQSDIDALPAGESFDLVLAHDVLCYLDDKPRALAKIARLLAPGGAFSVTDYHCGDAERASPAVVSLWGIAPPPGFAAYRALFERAGLSPLLQCDTTRQYREHWAAIRSRIEERSAELVTAVGEEATRAFAERAGSILEAVAVGSIGHLWAVLEPTRGGHA